MVNLAGNEKIIPTHLKVQKSIRAQRRVSKLNLKPQIDISAEFVTQLMNLHPSNSYVIVWSDKRS